ncbi:hypothetical protein BFW38_16440 [Terasakiispira papahanaumokuakeensis]|uniref:Type II secretion system protein N n=1 Tax=Terasakiispira papahanaumokuakeensis TaxID=197479 RepID=A0A1E2VD56_9GAMM|nr:hypothetical protein [Terasakiispira papahanaumokuakeensis]ODC04883.1 hypothetical protein BFW38_16440 [Terasakiispira papahanaumokuakeensis]
MRYVGQGIMIIATALVFIVTLILNSPLHYWTALLPPQIELNHVSGRLLDGQVQQLKIKPRQGWPLALGPIQWQLNLLTPSHIRLGQDWQLSLMRKGWTFEWQLVGGEMAAVDMHRWPMQVTGDWGGRMQIRTRGLRCLEASGGLSSHDITLHLPEPVQLAQSRLSVSCQATEDNPAPLTFSLQLATPPTIELNGQLSLQPQGGEGQINGHIAPGHPLAALIKLANAQLDPRHIDQKLHW